MIVPRAPGGLGRGESSRGALGEVTKSGTDAEAGPSPRDAPRAGRGAGAGARGGERIDTLGEAGSVAPLSVIVNTPPEENGSDAPVYASVHDSGARSADAEGQHCVAAQGKERCTRGWALT